MQTPRTTLAASKGKAAAQPRHTPTRMLQGHNDCGPLAVCGTPDASCKRRLLLDRSGATILSRDQEARLFRRMNCLKSGASRLEERLDPERPTSGDLNEIERLLAEARAVRNQIVEMNLGLVVYIARTCAGARYGLSECVSDGIFALMRAVDLFDVTRGSKFSTYAARSIRNHLWWSKRRFIRRSGLSLIPFEESLATSDSNLAEAGREQGRERLQSAIRRWLGRLDERERQIIVCRHGLGGVPEQTLAQLGQHLGISRQRVCQIEQCAHLKLRKWAHLEGIESSEF